MKILVCGSSGFIGKHLVKLLAEHGHKVMGLDLNRPCDESGLIDFHQGDIRIRSDVKRTIGGIDYVINLAAKHHDFGISKEEYYETNEAGSRCLLECLAESRVRKYIFLSSVAVYGNCRGEIDETTIPAPIGHYGASKLAAEKLARKWQEEVPSREVLIIRPPVVFGEGNTANMYSLIRQIDKGRFFYFGSNNVKKSVCYIKNLIDATSFCLEHLKPGVLTFNYVDKPDLAVKQVVDAISNALGRHAPSVSFPLWLGIAAALPYDFVSTITGKNFRVSSARVRKLASETIFAAKAIREYGFRPKFSTVEGLQNMVRWYLEQNTRPNP
ncbi:MAG: NAD-dependent epimerase/dehydratase family protein [Candidatus Hodarchaeota archaeon]